MKKKKGRTSSTQRGNYIMAGIKLFGYQMDAVRRLHTGSILCSKVGSGKSLTALAYYYIQNGGVLNTKDFVPMDSDADRTPLYIITTAHKRDTFEWDKELVHFMLDRDKVVIDSWNNIEKYTKVTGSFFIFDEQRVVGKGKWVTSFLKIAKANDWILLSATPGDKWVDYIPVFIANGFYRNRTDFMDQHAMSFDRYYHPTEFRNVGRLIRLRNRILVDMDFKGEAVSKHINIWVSYDMDKYKEIIRKRWDPWKDEPIENASQFCYCLRKVVNSDESRSTWILETMEKHPRVIIFYNFDYELEILRTMCEGLNLLNPGFEYAEWNGHKHQEIPMGDNWVYLVQYNAGAEGWNCIRTDTIIFYSQSYSYKTMIQAAGRIDRLNTPFKDLYYYHLKSKSGIDLAINKVLKSKKKFNERRFYER